MWTKFIFIISLALTIYSCGSSDILDPKAEKIKFDSLKSSVKNDIENDKFSDGELAFDSFKNTDTLNDEYYKLGGDIKLCVGKTKEAVALYQKSLQIKPSEEVYYKLARFFNDINSPENHILCVNELIKLNPKNPIYYQFYAQHFFKQGIYTTAIDNISKAINLSDNKVELYLIRADYKCLYGDTLGAISDCDSSILLDKNYCKAYLNKTAICLESHKPKLVLSTIKDAFGIDCDKGELLYRRGLAKLLLKDLIGGREDLIKAIKLNNVEAIKFTKENPDERFRILFTTALSGQK